MSYIIKKEHDEMLQNFVENSLAQSDWAREVLTGLPVEDDAGYGPQEISYWLYEMEETENGVVLHFYPFLQGRWVKKIFFESHSPSGGVRERRYSRGVPPELVEAAKVAKIEFATSHRLVWGDQGEENGWWPFHYWEEVPRGETCAPRYL